MLYGSETRCLKESDLGISHRTETSMCAVQLKDRRRPMDLVLILGLKETINQLLMVISVCWYDHVLRVVIS